MAVAVKHMGSNRLPQAAGVEPGTYSHSTPNFLLIIY
jgi:hypothetical protein